MARPVDVVVVGGGIVGASAAYFLGKAGVRSVLVERDAIAAHASGFSYGGIGGLGEGVVASPTFPLAAEGVRLHRLLAATLERETGVSCAYRERPVLAIAFSEGEASAMQAHLRWQKTQQGYRVRWLDRAELRAEEPRITAEAVGAVRVDGTSDVDSYRLVLALVQGAEAMGARVRSGRAVGLEMANGRVAGVRTERELIPCGAAVIATGPWAAECGGWLGVRIPVTPLKGQILRLRLPGPPVGFMAGWGKDYATTKADGLLWAGSTEEEAGFDETPAAAGRERIMASLVRMMPAAVEAELVRQTACLRPVVADGLPVLGRAPGVSNAFIGTGGGRQGIVLGPAMGKVLADLIARGDATLPIAPFDPARFGQGW